MTHGTPRSVLSVLTVLAVGSSAMAQGSQWAVRLNGLDAGAQASGIGIISMTWEVWARIPQYDPNYPTILPVMSSYGSWTTLCPLLSPGTGSCSGASGYGNPNDAPVSSLNLSQGTWHHLATVFGADPAPGYEFFVDGQLVQAVPPGGNAVAVGLETDLGCSRYIGYQSFLKADIDEVRISAGARYTTNFIPTPYFTPDASTVGLWHFNEGAGSTAHDASGNGTDFTLFGGYSWVDGIVPIDCNANGIPDNQELSASPTLDCNGNQRLDECDINQGSSADSNGNGIPDECERPFCFGDGLDTSHTTPCPCGNTGGPRRGCANSVNALGAVLAATGTTVPDAIVLDGSAMPASSLCIYLQGDSLADATFGDGVRCTGGNLIRLRTKSNVGGASRFPEPGDVSVSSRGQVTPGSGARRYYQTYYRNPAAAFCPPETFNVTNGCVLDW